MVMFEVGVIYAAPSAPEVRAPDSASNAVVARKARLAAGIATTTAAELARVARETWEAWESGAKDMPGVTLELFVLKLTKKIPIVAGEPLLVLYSEDQIPIDVIAKDSFLGVRRIPGEDTAVRSMSINKQGRPYVHKTNYKECHNKHARAILSEWTVPQ